MRSTKSDKELFRAQTKTETTPITVRFEMDVNQLQRKKSHARTKFDFKIDHGEKQSDKTSKPITEVPHADAIRIQHKHPGFD